MGKRNYAPRHTLTRAEILFLEKKVTGRSYAELTGMFNNRFGLDFTVPRLATVIRRLNLSNGRNSRFQPGHIPFNKGKCMSYPGCENKLFQPGHRPPTWKPVGTEIVDHKGYVRVKTRNPRTWKLKHRLLWEKAHGKIPRGHVVIFANSNRLNLSMDNLLLVSRRELKVMSHFGFITENGDLTKVGKTVSDIKLAISDLRRKAKKKGQRRKQSKQSRRRITDD